MPRPFLFVGDMHLGRRPTGLDEPLRSLHLDPRDLSPTAAWQATVDHALAVQARAVVLAGDVVDGERDRIEAYGVLEDGVRRLLEGGIPTFGVAGNHDGLVLPRLAKSLPGFHLLGEGGTWELHPLEGEPSVQLLGWSFPSPRVTVDPTTHASLQEALDGRSVGARVLGVVHGDLDVADSRYAPLSTRRLESIEVDAWFLGHIHRPHTLQGPRPLGYLGSLVGLDPGEPGPRGPWEVHVRDDGVGATQIPLVPIRWETLEVPLDDTVHDAEDVTDRIRAAVRDHADEHLTHEALQVGVYRIVLTGRLSARDATREAAHGDDLPFRFRAERIPCIVEKVIDRTQPAIDVEALANEPSPAGRIARRLLALEEEGAPQLEQAASRVLDDLASSPWRAVGPEPGLRARLEAACWRALETLVDQRDTEVV